MNSKKDTRTEYWDNNYKSYWMARVAEAGTETASKIIDGDALTEGNWVYEAVFNQYPLQNGSILDVGCAWGRMFPIFIKKDLNISGVDISPSMINAAKKEFNEHPQIHKIEVSTAEKLPFEDNYFDNIVCFGTFDAVYQDVALSDFFRVLSKNGCLYLTGKSTNYYETDKLAIAAEIGARKKGHPNFFTDVPKMCSQMQAQGIQILGQYYFPKRGDFSTFSTDINPKENYYEWFLVFKKTDERTHYQFTKFSDEFSNTFLKLEQTNNIIK